MGLPALRQYPRISAETTAQLAEPARAERRPQEARFDLSTIVEAVFDPSEDRVIYELPPGELWERVDGDCLLILGGAALAAAAACAEALDRQGRRQFVVVVVNAALFEHELQDSLACLARIRHRFVIVAPADPDASAAQPQLQSAGWQVVDLRGRIEARAVAKALIVARYDEQPTLIMVDAEAAPRRHPQRPLTDDERDPSRRATDFTTAMTADLRQRIAEDPRLMPVVLVDDPAWQSIERPDALRSTGRVQNRLERGLSIAGGIAHAGCRPLIIVESADLVAQPGLLADSAVCRGLRGTVIVLGQDSESQAVVKWPGEWDRRVLAANMSGAELSRVLTDCLGSERGTLLQVLETRPTSVSAAAVRGSEVGAAPGSRFAVIEGDEIGGALSAEFMEWVTAYERVGRRGRYLWTWCQTGLEAIALSCVDACNRGQLCDTKLLSVMYGVMLDDIADEMQDARLLEWLSIGCKDATARDFANCEPSRREYAELTFRIWDAYQERVRGYPRYREFERLLRYDNDQVLNTMRYSSLVNQHTSMINSAEHDAYAPHNMQMMTFATVDLMCSPAFDVVELGMLRAAMWHAQCMGRIGNMVSTWERELHTGDLTSGVLARLIETGQLSPDEVRERTGAVHKAVTDGGIEQFFLNEWERHRTAIEGMVPQVRSVNLRRLISGLDRLIRMELDSRGLK